MALRAKADALVFEEESPHEEGFSSHFHKFVKPKLIALEEERLAAVSKFRTRLFLTVLITVLTLLHFGVAFLGTGNPELDAYVKGADGRGVNATFVLVGFLLFAVTVVAWPWTGRARSGYYSRHKQEIVPEILKFVGDFEYSADQGVDERVLKEAYLFNYWNRYAGEDLVQGSFREHRFRFSEVKMSEAKAGEQATTVFRGFVLFLELPWQPRGVTVGVKDKSRLLNYFESFGKRFNDLKPVHFADSQLEDHYEVYSMYEADARRLVSRSLTQAIAEVKQVHRPESVEFAVVQKLFVLVVETQRELMEPGSLEKSVLTTKNARRFLADFQVVLHIVQAVAEGALSDDRSHGRDVR